MERSSSPQPIGTPSAPSAATSRSGNQSPCSQRSDATDDQSVSEPQIQVQWDRSMTSDSSIGGLVGRWKTDPVPRSPSKEATATIPFPSRSMHRRTTDSKLSVPNDMRERRTSFTEMQRVDALKAIDAKLKTLEQLPQQLKALEDVPKQLHMIISTFGGIQDTIQRMQVRLSDGSGGDKERYNERQGTRSPGSPGGHSHTRGDRSPRECPGSHVRGDRSPREAARVSKSSIAFDPRDSKTGGNPNSFIGLLHARAVRNQSRSNTAMSGSTSSSGEEPGKTVPLIGQRRPSEMPSEMPSEVSFNPGQRRPSDTSSFIASSHVPNSQSHSRRTSFFRTPSSSRRTSNKSEMTSPRLNRIDSAEELQNPQALTQVSEAPEEYPEAPHSSIRTSTTERHEPASPRMNKIDPVPEDTLEQKLPSIPQAKPLHLQTKRFSCLNFSSGNTSSSNQSTFARRCRSFDDVSPAAQLPEKRPTPPATPPELNSKNNLAGDVPELQPKSEGELELSHGTPHSTEDTNTSLVREPLTGVLNSHRVSRVSTLTKQSSGLSQGLGLSRKGSQLSRRSLTSHFRELITEQFTIFFSSSENKGRSLGPTTPVSSVGEQSQRSSNLPSHRSSQILIAPQSSLSEEKEGSEGSGARSPMSFTPELAQGEDANAIRPQTTASDDDGGSRRPTTIPSTQVISHLSLRVSGVDGGQMHLHQRSSRASRITAGQVVNWVLAGSEEHRDFTIHPSSPLRVFWDALVVVITFFGSSYIPLKLVYFGASQSDLVAGSFGHVLYVCDTIWLIDILFNFRTGFFQSGRLIMQPKRIALRYLRSWFFFDLIAACPLELSRQGGGYAWLLCWVKLIRLLRVSRCFRHLHGHYERKLMQGKTLFLVMIIIHLLSCFWRWSLSSDGIDMIEGLTVFDTYARDMYWVFTTISTVGYGDIHAEGTTSRIFSILVMITAPMYFGTIVSACSVATKYLFHDEVESRVDEATRFMRRRRLPCEVQKRVQLNLRHRLHEEHAFTLSPELFKALSPAVQREMQVGLLSGTVLLFPLFKNARHSFIAEIAQAHAWVQCLASDLVVEAGQSLLEVIFLVQARLLVNLGVGAALPTLDNGVPASSENVRALSFSGQGKLDQEDEEAEIRTGAWFGEIALFDSYRIRTSTATAVEESELAVLAANEYHTIIQKYPKLQQQHRQIERALEQGDINMTALAYEAPAEQERQRTLFRQTSQFMGRVTARRTKQQFSSIAPTEDNEHE